MEQEKPSRPYDFSDWEMGEDALSGVEVAVYELLDQAKDKTLRLNWPDFTNIHTAVLKLVRDQLAYAFNVHRSGQWRIDLGDEARLQWLSEIDVENEQRTIILGPRQIIPLFMAPLAEHLSQFPVPDYIEPQQRYSSDDDFDWDTNWLLAVTAARQWHRAILSTLKGLNALKAEREKLEEEAADEPSVRGDGL